MIGTVLVIGAGIAGLNAALELTAQGYKTVLVEKKPTIGGRMTQLDKMFPSDECGMCTVLPKLLEVTSNPNIQLMTYCEVVGVSGTSGDFKVKILKKPRYVDPMKCNACTECFPACPVGGVPMEFNYGRGASKAITFYSPFPPRKALIYPDACAYLKDGKCGDGEKPPCVEACKPGAIAFDQKPTEVEVNVGAIIIATGLDTYFPGETDKYGYGKFKNVLTSIEYERLLSGVGPTGGIIKRADGAVPEKVAWIQCVGPKEHKRGNTYCSAVCCMAATTEALGTLDRNKSGEVYIVHDDIVGYAKGFQEHYRHAQEAGVNYVRSRLDKVEEKENGDLVLTLIDNNGKSSELEVGMLVLSTNLIPHEENRYLSEILGVELDEHGFFKGQDDVFKPLQTTAEGIFVAGTAQGPKDISESISHACGAAAGAVSLLKDVRGTELVKPPEKKLRDVKPEDEPKIGVLLCDCGANIAGFIDMEELGAYARNLPNVEVVERDLFACGGALYKDMIANNDINRTVVVACSPKTHENLFGLHTESAGLNKYLMEIVNARNHCSWVHTTDKSKATRKAKKLLKMGVAKARLIEPLTTISSDVTQNCMVIGGGIGGITCANRLGAMGFDVHLIDRNKELGGKIRNVERFFMTGSNPEDFLSGMIDDITKRENVHIHTDTEVTEVNGFIGQFSVGISEAGESKTIPVGTIVVATGAEVTVPSGLYSYGEHKGILTQLEFEKKLKDGKLELKDDGRVTIISCVGSKEEGSDNTKTYCCNVGCGNMLKDVQAILTAKPGAQINVLHRDWTLPHKNAEGHRLELEDNDRVRFIRYSRDSPPEVSPDKLKVNVTNADTGESNELDSDLVILITPMSAPEGNNRLKDLLGLCLEPNNFFMGAIGKLKPLDFTADGLFLCGTAHSPKGITEVIEEAEGVASRVGTIITNNVLQKEPIISVVVDENCDGCAYCIDPCPANALTLIEYMKNGEIKKTVESNSALCKGCGICMATCPKQGIFVNNFKPVHFNSMIDAALEEVE